MGIGIRYIYSRTSEKSPPKDLLNDSTCISIVKQCYGRSLEKYNLLTLLIFKMYMEFRIKYPVRELHNMLACNITILGK